MSKDIQIQLGNLKGLVQADLDKFSVQVGVLEDKPAAKWKGPYRPFFGGKANKQAGLDKNITLRELLSKLEAVYNLLAGPWKDDGNKDVVEVTQEIQSSLAKSRAHVADRRRFENAAQAVVRNPILRGDYGHNSKVWQEKKGFDRLLINTGKLFSHIRARLVR